MAAKICISPFQILVQHFPANSMHALQNVTNHTEKDNKKKKPPTNHFHFKVLHFEETEKKACCLAEAMF